MHMSSGLLKKSVNIQLKTTHIFGNFTERLNASDKLWFRGILKMSLLHLETKPSNRKSSNTKNLPIIEISSIGCLQCSDKKLEPVFIPDGFKMNARLRDLSRGVKYLLNVLFNPLVTFK